MKCNVKGYIHERGMWNRCDGCVSHALKNMSKDYSTLEKKTLNVLSPGWKNQGRCH